MSLSVQFLEQLQQSLMLTDVIGMHPLQAPATFPIARASLLDDTGWGTLSTLQRKFLIVLHPKQELLWAQLNSWTQQHMSDPWFVLTPRSSGQARKWLQQRAQILHSFPRGSRILHQKNAWKQHTTKTRTTKIDWVLWGNRRQHIPPLWKQQVASFVLDKHGNSATRSLWEEDTTYGIAAAHYRSNRFLIATDGSVQADGSMGAAATTRSASSREAQEAVRGPPSSTAAELVALRLATGIVEDQKDVTILTDSLSSLHYLDNRKKADFQLFPEPQSLIGLVDKLVRHLNSLVTQGYNILLAKVKAHARDPLNERADQLADAAADLDPEEDITIDHTYCRIKFSDSQWKVWSAPASKRVVQQVANWQLRAKLAPDLRPDPVQTEPPPKSEEWLLWKNASRPELGLITSAIPHGRKLKTISQAISNNFPTQARKHIWNPTETPDPSCPLGCGAPTETFAHIQCLCPRLQQHRISAHHKVWNTILDCISKYMPHPDFTVIQEATVHKILQVLEDSNKPPRIVTPLKHGFQQLRDTDLCPSSLTTASSALPPIIGCAVLPSTKTRPLAQQYHRRTRRRTAPPTPIPPFFPSLAPTIHSTISQPTHHTKIHPPPDAALQRPDGLLIDWDRQKVIILEYTRAYDQQRKDLAIANITKLLKYENLSRQLHTYIPYPWQISIATFSTGVRGTADKKN